MGRDQLEAKSSAPDTDDDIQQSLYAKRQKIYPRQVHGIFQYLRITAVAALLGIFYGFPWLDWNGHQSVLFDLPARKFYIFGWTFWPQDFIYLAGLLIIAGLSLFFFTALAGRLWCGYACPQTVWTETFIWIEQWVEGDRLQQMKLDKAPMSWRKFRIKATKHALWIAFAAFTGFTFVSFFTPRTELWHNLVTFQLGPWESFWMVFYGFATWGNAGFLREQVCLYMCPYARFQSAMFDRDTLVISYDTARGEPRGSRKRSVDHRARGMGDCIDCTMCVQVCPTGIDIRKGLQYECIGCAACIDACDDVMDRMKYPRGLIRYTTENTIAGKTTHVLRPRIVLYGMILLAITISLGVAIASRIPLELDVMRDRNQLFRETSDGLIENVYTLTIINMDPAAHVYRLTAEGIPGLVLDMDTDEIRVDAGSVLNLPIRLRAREGDLHARSSEVAFTLTANEDPALRAHEEARFLGPGGVR